jgi:hypothetical protein
MHSSNGLETPYVFGNAEEVFAASGKTGAE